jgi:hypothetical protein
MQLIIGGAYQGKLEYAKKTYNLKDEDIFECSLDGALEYKSCINHLDALHITALKTA